jgi:hypothetical protein
MPARLRDIRTLQTLRRDHDDIRTGLSAAAAETGSIAAAAQPLADLCRRHFDFEETKVFPLFAQLQTLLSAEPAGAARAAIRGHLDGLRHQHDEVVRDHQAILTAGAALKEAANREGRQHLVELGQILINHERLEEDLRLAVYELCVLRQAPETGSGS